MDYTFEIKLFTSMTWYKTSRLGLIFLEAK